MDCDCIILAGGESKRFGEDKLSTKVGAKTLLESVIDSVTPYFEKAWIVGGKENPDLIKAGPLGGIYTGLKLSNKRSFVIGGDMPFFNSKLADILFEKKGEAVVPVHENGFIEPLFAFYEPSICPIIEDYVKEGERKIRGLLDRIDAHYISVSELRVHDPDLKCFVNVNTKEDLSRTKQLLS